MFFKAELQIKTPTQFKKSFLRKKETMPPTPNINAKKKSHNSPDDVDL